MPALMSIGRVMLLLIFTVGSLTLGPLASQPAVQASVLDPLPKAKDSEPLLKFPEDDLPGKYYFGDGLGSNNLLELATDHHFKFRSRGCVGVHDQNSGNWELKGDVLILKPKEPNRRTPFTGVSTRLVPLKCGTTVCLIAEHTMPLFCTGTKYYIYRYEFGKLIDGNDGSLEGLLTIPDRYLDFYKNGSIEAKVVKVERGGRSVYIDKGAHDRVKKDMLMCLAAFNGRIDLRITEVGERESIAEVIYFEDSNEAVAVGQEFTTGRFFFAPRPTGYKRFNTPPKLGVGEGSFRQI